MGKVCELLHLADVILGCYLLWSCHKSSPLADFETAVTEDMAGQLRRQVAEHADWLTANCERQVYFSVCCVTLAPCM